MAPSDMSVKTADGRTAPHPSYIEVAKPFIFEPTIHECLTSSGLPENRDDKIRLEGISWIDSVRKALHLPVRTYNTAAVYYHKFRLAHPENIGHLDAAAAALFAACKIEDTLKKSKEILCAAHNMRGSPSERLTPDDPIFEQHSKTIIGLERLMLEASGFDFRNRYPQRLVLKLLHPDSFSNTNSPSPTSPTRPVAKTAYNICLDLYRTFVPLKQTSPTMALACAELACRLHDIDPLPTQLQEIEGSYPHFQVSRSEVMETLFDLLDLYSDARAATLVGPTMPMDKFLQVRIVLNNEVSANPSAVPVPASSSAKSMAPTKQSHKSKHNKEKKAGSLNGVSAANGGKKSKAPRSPMGDLALSPTNTNAAGGGGVGSKPGLKEGTVRFMLSEERARDEKEWVAGYFQMEEEEYLVEVPVEGGRGRR